MSQLVGELKRNRKQLRIAIGKAKKEAWNELLEGLNRDPWGRPYKNVMKQVKLDNVEICRKLPIETIEDILRKLFPRDGGTKAYSEKKNEVKEWISAITVEELQIVIKRTIKKVKKPRARTVSRHGWWPRVINIRRQCTGVCTTDVSGKGYFQKDGKLLE